MAFPAKVTSLFDQSFDPMNVCIYMDIRTYVLIVQLEVYLSAWDDKTMESRR